MPLLLKWLQRKFALAGKDDDINRLVSATML
jgi:hypothetical protein